MSSIISDIKSKVDSTSTPSGHHYAAMLPSQGARFQITHRPTPTPGPNELLIAVHYIALNPIDHYQRDMGFPPLAGYPSILGSDISGTVVASGSSVPLSAPPAGARVAAFAPSFFMKGVPDYGALQARVLVPWQNAVPLPQEIRFKEACILPVAVLTAWSGWYSIGVPRDTAWTAADKKGMLVWGASGSVGSAVVQVARSMGFTVYATASEKHHAYIKELGASKVFDYKREDVVKNIVDAVKEDGVTVQTGYDAAGQLKECLEVLKALKGEGVARLASAVPIKEDSPKVEGVEASFVAAPQSEEERMEHFHFIFGIWLKDKLEKKEFVPSPRIKVVEGGLDSANEALDILKKGVSGIKLVLEV